jgi:HEAT repeat protein/energy-coupling factor transporter ATP-binding protein EcfA2
MEGVRIVTLAAADPPEEQLTLLARYLDSERGGLLIVVSPDAEAERALAEELRLRVKEDVHLETASFAAEPVAGLSLSHHLSMLPPRQGKAAVLVFGLDDLPPEARTTAINAMNWGRERVRQSGYSVVLWVRPGTPGELGNRAPDFFSWRGNVFEFDVPTEIGDRQQMLARLRLFAPASLDELRQRYNEYVIRTCQWVDLRGVLQMRNIVRLPLADVFVPLQATIETETSSLVQMPTDTEDFLTPLGEGEHFIRTRIERRIALADTVRQHQHLVILGDPGAGKSTLLRFLALTYAQGADQVQRQFGVEEQRLPVLVPLSAFSEAQSAKPDLTLAAFLSQYFLTQGLPDFSPILTEALTRERAFLLLDGLDEMLTTQNRMAVAQAISAFSRDYPAVRVAVTSRIAGYASGLLPGHFTTVTIAPFDDAEIARFARQWSLAFEANGLPPSELPTDARQRAERRAENLTKAATSHPGVKRLATNPLLLTLLALIHYQGTRLPNRRADLYRLCVEALAETWNLARSLSGKAIDLHLGEQRLDEEFVVDILGPVAYWMHKHKPTGLIERTELEARIAEHFVEETGAPVAEAETSAREFVTLVREQMGLLVERAPDLFSFLHLSFQEYLAARYLSGKANAFELLKPRLHRPRWREVVLLTAGCLHGDYASQFVENILNAHSDYDDLLHRDLLLAAHCIGDEVTVPLKLQRDIRDQLLTLWRNPPFPRLQEEIVKTFGYLRDSQIGRDIYLFLFSILVGRHDENDEVRDAAQRALGRGGRPQDRVLTTLLIRLRNKKEAEWERLLARLALGLLNHVPPPLLSTLLKLLKDKQEDEFARAEAAKALGTVGQHNAEVINTLLTLLRTSSEQELVRDCAISALGKIGQDNTEVLRTLLALVRDAKESGRLRRGTTLALGQLGRGNAEVLTTLETVINDEPDLREAALDALWEVIGGDEGLRIED